MPLSATNISFNYPKGPLILDAVDCTIKPAAITAIVGPNGAGKSTLLRLLAGLSSPHTGTIEIDQTPLNSLTPTQRATKLAYIAQRSALAFDFDVKLVVSFGRLALKKDPAAIDRALERFDLTHLANTPLGTLSVGQQQRVSLARAWAQLDDPLNSPPNAYLLADEPTSAMDPKHQLHTMHALEQLASTGVGIALVAHDLTLAARYADRAILLNTQGQIQTQGPINQVLTPKTLTQVFDTPFISGQIQGHPVLLPLTTTTAAPQS